MAVAPASSQISFDKSLIKVVLLENVHRSAVEALRADGYGNVHQHARALEGDALKEAIADAHILGIRSRTQLTRTRVTWDGDSSRPTCSPRLQS